jgi:hypothetical protein
MVKNTNSPTQKKEQDNIIGLPLLIHLEKIFKAIFSHTSNKY